VAAEAPLETSQIHLQHKVNIFISSEENAADVQRKSGAFTCSAQLDSKGRITVPSGIRKRLGLETGDSLGITVENATVREKKVSDFEEAKAFVDSFSSIESFSFDGETVEVVVSE